MAKKETKEVVDLRKHEVMDNQTTVHHNSNDDVKVLVLGKNEQRKKMVADVIHHQLQSIGMPLIQRHEFHAPGKSHPIETDEPSVLDIIERRDPRLFSTGVIIACDNFLQPTDGQREMPKFGAGVKRDLDKLFDNDIGSGIARQVLFHTETALRDAISGIVSNGLDELEDCYAYRTAGPKQTAIMHNFLHAIAVGDSAIEGMTDAVAYARSFDGEHFYHVENNMQELLRPLPVPEPYVPIVASPANRPSMLELRAANMLMADVAPEAVKQQLLSSFNPSKEDETAMRGAYVDQAIQVASNVIAALSDKEKEEQEEKNRHHLFDLHQSDKIDKILDRHEGDLEGILDDLYEVAKELPPDVSIRGAGVLLKNDKESGPEVQLNHLGLKLTRF